MELSKQQELAELSRRLLSLAEWTQQLSLSVSADQLGEAALSALRRVLNFDTGAIYLLGGREALRVLGGYGLSPDEQAGAETQAWEGHPGHVVRSQAPLFIGDAHDDASPLPENAQTPRAIIAAPIIFAGRCLGVVSAASYHPDVFTSTDLELLNAFANQVALAITNHQLYGHVRQQTDRLIEQIERANDVIMNLDLEGRLALFNATAERILGYPREEVLARPIESLLADGNALEFREGVYEAAFRRADGQPVTLEITLTPLFESDQPGGFQLIGRDVTERRRLERMRTEFVTTVSHELRTPLASIQGFLETLIGGKPGPLTEVQREFLNTSLESAHRLAGLVSELLDTARVESGTLHLYLTDVHLGPLVDQLVQAVQPVAEAHGLALKLERAPDDLYTVLADRQRMEQVINNLLSNALKFTPPGGCITIRLARETLDGSAYLLCEVSDTGIGIPPDDLPHIFERFHRGANVIGQAVEGTGIGLYLSRAFVEQHGGVISIESRLNEGTRVTVRLPLS
jgi:PAS domain S-box-containing protein